VVGDTYDNQTWTAHFAMPFMLRLYLAVLTTGNETWSLWKQLSKF